MLILKVLCLVVIILAALYMILIMPRMMHRPSRESFTHVLYAHRGLHDNSSDAPENSMAAFKKAVDGGYGIECDVQLTRDGVPVIFHDFTLARVARYQEGCAPADAVVNPDGSLGVKGKVIDYTYEELMQFHLLGSSEKIPKFGDFLRLVDGKVPLIVELKIEYKDLSVCPVVDTLLGEYKGVYCIESFNPLGVLWYRRHRPEVFRGQLSDEFHKDKPDEFSGPLYFILTNLLLNILGKPDFIAFNHRYSDSLARTLCRKVYGCTSAAWTIKNEEDLEKAKKNFDIFIFDSFIPKQGSKA
ncbi:glycerophosphodiester phosphodiesterase family protein [Butyrivibrio sp. YAB3001]|uniref:glycerophosphodiester phosphodiesterase family protein n=1 Tax=Butyrivibrio sp. YAB3001 TaxID=1520812 RepID=UPI0008F61957|nr:glycerophosphodiester phosphodiesterase family protein [Butyrivibrio sp. YAB3001]SFB70446.1 Glycerophosphoryl diester phosphodiesterase [Butyrivibrio sp. YAB3001]